MIRFNPQSASESRTKTKGAIKPTSQKGRILSRLRADYPNWTPAYKLRDPDGCGEILQQNARVWELKHLHRIEIENREQWIRGVCHSYYRLGDDRKAIEANSSAEVFEQRGTLFPLIKLTWTDPEEVGQCEGRRS